MNAQVLFLDSRHRVWTSSDYGRLVRYDLRGTGMSPRDCGAFTLDAFTGALLERFPNAQIQPQTGIADPFNDDETAAGLPLWIEQITSFPCEQIRRGARRVGFVAW